VFDIEITTNAREMLEEISDQGTQKRIARKIRKLSESPAQQGKPLVKELMGYRRIPAAGRYRVVYRIDDVDSNKYEGCVVVVGIGIRRAGSRDDIYARLLGII